MKMSFTLALCLLGPRVVGASTLRALYIDSEEDTPRRLEDTIRGKGPQRGILAQIRAQIGNFDPAIDGSLYDNVVGLESAVNELTPCAVADTADGVKVTCGDTTAEIFNGAPGPQGDSCAVMNTEGGIEIACGDSTATVMSGPQGEQGPPGPSGSPLAAGDTLNFEVSSPVSTENTGAGQSLNNHQPSLGINYIIAVEGVFPLRSRRLSNEQEHRRLSSSPLLGTVIMFAGNLPRADGNSATAV